MKSARFKNVGAIAYTLSIYCLGVVLIVLQSWQLNVLGVVLLIHAFLLTATFTHEFIHGNIFKDRKWNAFWGQVMTHMNGACYATWDALVEHHFNHHLHHADFVGFDILKYLNTMNPLLRLVYVILEWLYFPILEFEMRWRVILAPFFEPAKRSLVWRTFAFMLYRTAAFALLAWVSWKGLLLYFLAYVSFVNIMRFADAFHHTYDYAIVGQDFPKRDRVYEQEHTFSNLVSFKYPWLNLLFLNFGYHNAHHHNMSVPWHELPELHQKLYSEKGGGLLPLPRLVSNYHRFRLYRLFSGQGDAILESESALDSFTGGVAVSFLTPP
ncbi:MAG: fatty acid desaturase [Drouetiella hepatica Uher 2000/2452]|jgi:fatty acid desaturase|uniref:Fatty acid desaturase n=1 Tax=Drouetiella hepatica Uher 2000/2452 TaxID=904376 RepID=A0A951QFR7_9CYAN|nr:fatty acid desaturase [Drouetiella hepatica Uher 2000/2452]